MTENRGGNHKQHKFEKKLIAVQNYINSFNCDKAHYCRGKTKRYYLAADLNISKLFRMYNRQADENLKVKKGYFRKIFNNYYNLVFGSPRTDVCSTCLQYDELIKTYEKEKDLQKKLRLSLKKNSAQVTCESILRLSAGRTKSYDNILF